MILKITAVVRRRVDLEIARRLGKIEFPVAGSGSGIVLLKLHANTQHTYRVGSNRRTES